MVAEHPLGAQAVLDVGEGHDGATALPQLDRRRDVGDGKHRAVAPEEPVQIAADRLARRPRKQHRALRGRIGRPVRMPVVDRLVAVAPEQLVRAVIPQRRDRGRVGEPDHAVGIHDPDRLRRRLQHGGEEVLGTDVQASQVGEGMGHAKPPSTVESTRASRTAPAEGARRDGSGLLGLAALLEPLRIAPITITYREHRDSAWPSRRSWASLRLAMRTIRGDVLSKMYAGPVEGPHADPAASTQRASGSAKCDRTASPCEVFPPWRRAQLEVDRQAHEAPLAPCVLRTTGFLRPELAERITDWFTGKPTAPTDAVRQSYRALERETARLFDVVGRAPSVGGLGVRVQHVRSERDPYRDAAELCAELREHGSMRFTTFGMIAHDESHPLLGGEEGGVFDQLRVVHDVFGHAALGVGFDLQSEFATWLQCRTLFSDDARRAAFCELVGAVTTYVMTGEKPALRADLPPAELVAACDVDANHFEW